MKFTVTATVVGTAVKFTICAVTTEPPLTTMVRARAAGLFCVKFTDDARGEYG